MSSSAKKISSFFFVLVVAAAGLFGGPFYHNHIRELSGTGYANVYKMISEKPYDQEIIDQLADDLVFGYLSASDFQALLIIYNKKYGGFEGVPILIGTENPYPRSQYKQKVVEAVEAGDDLGSIHQPS